MRKFCMAILLSASSLAFGHSVVEENQCVEFLVQLVASSPEWDDCGLDESDAGAEIEVMFPDMNSVFESSIPANHCGSGWSAIEKKTAYINFLVRLSETNETDCSQEYLSTGFYALLVCRDKKFPECLGPAINILRNGHAPCKDIAADLVLEYGMPSAELNDLFVRLATNTTTRLYGKGKRAFSSYLEKLSRGMPQNLTVVTNAARTFYRNRQWIGGNIMLDNLFCRAYSSYEHSSNRLEVAEIAVNDSLIANDVRAYFISVTNSLHSVTNGLSVVPELQ